MMTQCLTVFTQGVHRSDMGLLGSVVSRLYAYSDETPLISIESVYCYCDLDREQADLFDVCWIGLLMIKIFQTQR